MRVGRSDLMILIDFPTERTAMDGEGAGLEEAAAQTAKDEQISLLKTVLVQLSDELRKKDERIAELETRIHELTDQDVVAMTMATDGMQSSCPHCSRMREIIGRGQSSTPADTSTPSPVSASTPTSVSDRFARNLSPIEEGVNEARQKVAEQSGAGPGSSGSRSNQNTPRRERMDREQQKLQQAIAALDAAIAELELQATSEQRLGALRKERSHLMTELNRKVQLRLRKVRRNSDEVLTRLATEYENCSKDQICDAVRELDRAQTSYKSYIDQLLAVVLETSPTLLEGMPRLQQSNGLRMDLLRVASRGELFEDLQERERNVASLQSYATQLAQRIMQHAPPLLPAVDTFHTTADMELDPAQDEALATMEP